MSKQPLPTVDDILRGSSHALTIFKPGATNDIKLFAKRGKPYLKCFASGKDRPAKPEEIVRQLYLKMLMDDYGYPAKRIAIEKPVQFGSDVHTKSADIVIWDKNDATAAYIIVECKKPKRSDGLEQLKSYCNAEGSPIGVWTNGGAQIIKHREEPNIFRDLPDLPLASQSLADLESERWTLDDLRANNKLAQGETLMGIIHDMEDLVLANAGVDAFDEVFKLIYAKLYDEAQAAKGGRQKRYLQFRVERRTAAEFKDQIDKLFENAKKEWPGVFLRDEKIELSAEHLKTCGSALETVKLFNSNLQVIDEAFEYLSLEVGKGKKGQYFTPRYVIDMAVKILNPTIDENVIDTASGSCGFTVHSIFHVWGEEFNAKGPERWQAEYASQRVYAIDFDPRSIKIAKALNLIAGDGRTNVFRSNSLDPRSWSDEIRVGLRNRLMRFPQDAERDRWNQEHFRYFDFDLLLTNPPFAGDIKETRILHQYDLAKKPNGKWQNKIGRDALFIERNLDFLRPGGRMAIVLPQGRMNNTTDKVIRDYIADKARILAVVGLHGNTFKPHTGTKTSVLFLQKWNDDPDAGPLCPHVDDYPVFFATSQVGGKDNSGNYVYLTDDRGVRLTDMHAHPIVDHDLFNLRAELEHQYRGVIHNATKKAVEDTLKAMYKNKLQHVPDRPGIADAFREWGRKQGFGFCNDEGGE